MRTPIVVTLAIAKGKRSELNFVEDMKRFIFNNSRFLCDDIIVLFNR